jgi:DNA-binding CsgD family transcriptional regulator
MSMSSDLRLSETLTDREMEVLRLIAEGKTNPEIGEALGIRFPTAKWYVSEVLQKLQVPTREAAPASSPSQPRSWHRIPDVDRWDMFRRAPTTDRDPLIQ